MSLLREELKKENKKLFSFYLISGDREENKKDILEFLEKDLDFKVKGNADFFIFEGEKFLIDKAREIKSINSKTITSGKNRIFILSFDSVGTDTQNALLKVLEEPIVNTVFFFLVSNLNSILETIKSRARIIEINFSNINDTTRKYLQSNFLDREKIIKELDNKNIDYFFNSLDLLLIENRKKIKDFSIFYKKFLSIKKYIGQKGVSIKHIFGYLNIYLPQV